MNLATYNGKSIVCLLSEGCAVVCLMQSNGVWSEQLGSLPTCVSLCCALCSVVQSWSLGCTDLLCDVLLPGRVSKASIYASVACLMYLIQIVNVEMRLDGIKLR